MATLPLVSGASGLRRLPGRETETRPRITGSIGGVPNIAGVALRGAERMADNRQPQSLGDRLKRLAPSAGGSSGAVSNAIERFRASRPTAAPTPTMAAPTGPANTTPLPATQGALPPAPPAMPAPTGPVGGVPPVAGAAITPLNPAQDLRFTAITPDNAGAPNLTQLAQQKFQDFLAQTADERREGVRSIGQAAAKFGRIGAGMTTNQLTSLEDLLQRRENEAARGLASDVAISDLGERRAQRDELRGERGFQYGLGRDALNDRIQQRLLEEQLLNSAFGRDVTRTQLGFQGNPAGLQFDASRDFGQSASDALGGLGDYLGNRELLEALARARLPQVTPEDAARLRQLGVQ